MRKLVVAIVALAGLASAHADSGVRDPFAVRKPDPQQVVTPAPVIAPAVVAAPGIVKPAPCDCDVIDHGKPQRRAALWTFVGGSLVLGASFTVSEWARVKYDAALARGPEGYAEANDMQRIARNYGTGLFVVGTAAVGVAAYLYFTAPDKVVRERRTAVVPAISGDGAGIAVAGGF